MGVSFELRLHDDLAWHGWLKLLLSWPSSFPLWPEFPFCLKRGAGWRLLRLFATLTRRGGFKSKPCPWVASGGGTGPVEHLLFPNCVAGQSVWGSTRPAVLFQHLGWVLKVHPQECTGRNWEPRSSADMTLVHFGSTGQGWLEGGTVCFGHWWHELPLWSHWQFWPLLLACQLLGSLLFIHVAF